MHAQIGANTNSCAPHDQEGLTGMENVRTFGIHSIDEEPWVYLPNGNDLAGWGVEQEIRYNQRNRHAEKYRFFVNIFDFLKDNRISGDYFEFGCHRCRSFRMALTEARRHGQDKMRFYAFDSFDGLPQPVHPTAVDIWQRGALRTSLDTFMETVRGHGIYVDQVIPVEGFYDTSLTRDLQRDMLSKGSRASLINVDCDLYESAVPVFEFIEPFLQEGTVIYLDDAFAGYKGSPERGTMKAFREFAPRSAFKFVAHMNIGWWGRSYISYTSDHNADEGP